MFTVDGNIHAEHLNALSTLSRFILRKPDSFSTSQEILCVLWQLKVHNRAHNSLLSVPV
jgi:hypothetical protein